MKKVLFALAAVLAAATVSAQEKPQIGVGAALGTQKFVMSSAGTVDVLPGTAITLPINVAPGIRVEPFLGLTRIKVTDSTSTAGDVVNTDTEFDLGCGVYLTKEVAQNVELYGGGKVDIAIVSTKVETPVGDASDSFTGFGIAAVGGAEYYLSPRFALGVEAELGLKTIEVATDVRKTDITTASFVTAKVFFK